MLDEDLKNVLDLKESVIRRIREHLDHVAKLRVQIIAIAIVLFSVWHIEVNRSLQFEVSLAAIELVGEDDLLVGEQGLSSAFLA